MSRCAPVQAVPIVQIVPVVEIVPVEIALVHPPPVDGWLQYNSEPKAKNLGLVKALNLRDASLCAQHDIHRLFADCAESATGKPVEPAALMRIGTPAKQLALKAH
jgi:hypothetical protein